MSRSSMSSGDSPTDEKNNGLAKSPSRNGAPARPGYDRADTGGEWATENEDEKVCIVILP